MQSKWFVIRVSDKTKRRLQKITQKCPNCTCPNDAIGHALDVLHDKEPHATPKVERRGRKKGVTNGNSKRLSEGGEGSAVSTSATLAAKAARYLGDFAAALPVPKAIGLVDDKPGLYAIFINDPKSLPQPFSSMLIRHGARLLYVGRARDSLSVRLVDQELRHKRAATFFRGVGAILGFRPQPGSLRDKANQRNYRFSKSHTGQIIDWMEKHLLVRWLPMEVTDLLTVEPTVIHELRPLLNTTHNPDRCDELAELRELCRRIACQ
jgi:hypothetical protein